MNVKYKSTKNNEYVQAELKASFGNNNYNQVIWLLGDGRSGTTWVADLINHDNKLREIFEPFHPKFVDEINFILPHQYIRPDELKQELYDICAEIFSGKFNNNRVDGGNKFLNYNGLLIKDIFANLLSYSISLHFPKVKPVLLIRNPFAVALSKYKKKDWFWVTDPLDLFNQIALREDYLLPFEDIIKKTSAKKDYLLNQILIWSIINYVPLRQFTPANLHYCFYESLYSEPSLEVSKIFEFVKGAVDNSQDAFSLSNEVVNRPSRVVGTESNILSGTSPITSWKNEISYGLVEEGLEILKHFGLDDLYDENSIPNEKVLRRVQETQQ